MVMMWDYDIEELKKTEEGRIKILERQINYGIPLGSKEKIKLADVRKYWNRLEIRHEVKNLFELLLWGKIISQKSKKQSWI